MYKYDTVGILYMYTRNCLLKTFDNMFIIR